MATTFGTRPEDTVADSRGNVVSGVAINLYPTEADATARTSLVASVQSDTHGLWPFSDTGERAQLWARDPAGRVWPVTSNEAFALSGAGVLAAATAAQTAAESAADSAAAAATLVGAPADTAMAAVVANPASATAVSLSSTIATAVQGEAARADALFVPRSVVASSATAALVRKLRTGQDGANVLLLGDSTGNETTEWFQQAMTALAARFPTVRATTRLWNTTTQVYDAPTVLQAGTGVARGLYATQSNGGYIATPDSAQVSVTGDIDIQVKCALDDWTPSAAFELTAKSNAGPDSGWFLRINTTGTLTLFWTIDGTAMRSASSTVGVPFADGATGWVRVTLDVDNGAAGCTATFYTSTDGTTWTALGTPVVQGTVTSLFDSTARLQLIGRGTQAHLGAGSGMTGYRLRIYSGLTMSNLVADLDCADMVNATTAWVDSVGVTWTPTSVSAGSAGQVIGTPTLALYNGSAPGMAIAYSNDGTRFAKQARQPWTDLAFISYSHNEGMTVDYRPAYKQLADALIAKYPDVGIVASTQNPQTAPRTAALIGAHASRNAVIRSLAASQRYALVDAFDAFTQAGNLSTLVNPADGVHPVQAGSDLWAAQAEGLFDGF